jgi:D-lactate dehydrogenase (cytochrome)
MVHAAAEKTDPGRVKACIAELTELLGDRLSLVAAIRERHGRDESHHPGSSPDAVAFARSTEEVAAIVRACARHLVPVIPFGTGTSLEGHIAALRGGISLDLSQMDRIVRVSADDLDCTVEAGVTRIQLNEHLRDTGLFFPIDPGANASLGGMAATRASGTNAVRYGTMRENVLGLTVVTADGRIMRTGGRARKSSAGYDLTRLFVGSEGTLGVITEVTLRLYGIPEAISAATACFATIGGAVDTVIRTIQSGIPIARIELIDEASITAINRYSKLDLPVRPTLFLEFHGTERGVAEQAEMVEAIASENGGEGFAWATKAEERNRLWAARHNAFYATQQLRPGAKAWPTDVCVPISRLADCIRETHEDLAQAGVVAPLVGHVGDGNFHLIFLYDEHDPAEVAQVKALNGRLVARAIAMGGTITGEHGIGYGKIAYLEAEHGAATALMRDLKRTFDPLNILNPGKVVVLG